MLSKGRNHWESSYRNTEKQRELKNSKIQQTTADNNPPGARTTKQVIWLVCCREEWRFFFKQKGIKRGVKVNLSNIFQLAKPAFSR